jgi:hypothetical protein
MFRSDVQDIGTPPETSLSFGGLRGELEASPSSGMVSPRPRGTSPRFGRHFRQGPPTLWGQAPRGSEKPP